MGLHFLNILFVVHLGGLPRWGQSRNQCYGPRGVLGLLLAIVSVLLVVGDSPDGL
jgi:hypothetical protein